MKIKSVYQKLNKKYGHQGWWPLSKNSLHSKHHNGPPRNNRDRFEIIVGAILTQNTSWKNVEKAIYNLNKAKVLDSEKIRKIDVNKLAKLILHAGYYNQKAATMKRMADFFLKNKNPTRQQLLAVKGIGPETADSILLYAYEHPVFVIDAYTKRIFSRLGECDENCKYGELQEIFMGMPKDVEVFKQYHALIVEHAKKKCSKTPLCESCCLNSQCRKFKNRD